jgi:Mg-chelatase subunit ChlD
MEKELEKKVEVEVVFILDRSGSMQGLESDTIGGYNKFLLKQKDLKEKTNITTILFNTSTYLLHDRIDVKDISSLTNKDYSTFGGTALYDAIGYGIEKIVLVCKSTKNVKRRVIFVIITDGEENSSKNYSYKEIKELITKERVMYNFEFIFLGANIDAPNYGESLGIDRAFCKKYKSTRKGTSKNYDVLSDMVYDSIDRDVCLCASELNKIEED